VVGTVKYTNTKDTNLTEISFAHNNFQGSPVILTDMNASSTQVIKRDAWGSILTNSFETIKQIPTSYGYTGHKYDEQSDVTYAHARYLNNKSKIWLSHDPFSIENYSSDIWLLNPSLQNSYSYSTNDPVNKVDPDGKMSIAVPGTWYQEDSWNTTSNPLFMSMLKSYNEIPIVINDKQMWSGKDQMKARIEAAENIANMINNHKFEPGEKLNVACHSHGGTVCKLVSGMIKHPIDELTTLGTPFLPEIRIDKKNVKNYTEIYSERDWTQLFAGTTASFSMLGGFAIGGAGGGAVGGPPGAAFGMLGGTVLGLWLNWGEMGLIKSRQDPDANKSYNASTQTNWSFSPSTAHGQLWGVGSIWTDSRK
jgi:RHS repeat-associated protein